MKKGCHRVELRDLFFKPQTGQELKPAMSMHKSLVSKNKLARQRSVLTRAERLKVLEEDGRWSNGDSVFGLPKVRTFVAKKARKVKKPKEDEAAATGEAAPAEAGAVKSTPEGKK